MPTYYAAGVTTRLSLASLAASTTANATVRGGTISQNNVQAADWTLRHGTYMKELEVRCFDEDGRLHFIGKDGEVPFLCVAVAGMVKQDAEQKDVAGEAAAELEIPTKQAESTLPQLEFHEPHPQILQSIEHANEDSSLTSLGSTPATTPADRPETGTPPIGRIPKYNTKGKGAASGARGRGKKGRGGRGRNTRTNQVKQTDDVSASPAPILQPLSRPSSRLPVPALEVAPSQSLLIKLKARKPSTEQPKSTPTGMFPLTKQSTPDHIANTGFVTEAKDKTKSSSIKALSMTTQLSTNSFTRRSNGCSEDLKIEVLFNGTLTGCAYVSQRDKSSSNALTLRFSGRRTNRVLERAWIFDEGVSAVSEDKGTGEAKRQKRWNEICAALRTEANTIGFDEEGNRPPSGDVLWGLAKMPLPEPAVCSSSAVGAQFGVIDLIITLGEGKKFGTTEGYLTNPQRLKDTQFKPRDLEQSEEAAMLMPPPAVPMRTTPAGDSGTRGWSAITTVSPSTIKKDFDFYALPKAFAIGDGIAQLRAELNTASEQPKSLAHTPTSLKRTISPGSMGSWSNKSVQGRKQPVPPVLSPTPGWEVSPSTLRQSQGSNQIQDILESPEQAFGSRHLPSLTRDPRTVPATGTIAVPQEVFASQTTPTQQSRPRPLFPIQRLGRSPLKAIDVSSLTPALASLGNVPESQWLSQVIPSQPTPPTPIANVVTKKGVFLELKMPSPRSRRASSLSIFDGPTTNKRKANKVDSAYAGSSIEPESAIDKPSLKRKVSKGPSSSQSTPKQKRRKPNTQVKTEDPDTQYTSVLPSSSSSPTKQVPPPWSSPIKEDEFVVPNLCEGCCISYAEPTESNNGGTRQIRKERGGTFREREVLVAMRFIVGW